jgi:hypothetical protein
MIYTIWRDDGKGRWWDHTNMEEDIRTITYDDGIIWWDNYYYNANICKYYGICNVDNNYLYGNGIVITIYIVSIYDGELQ